MCSYKEKKFWESFFLSSAIFKHVLFPPYFNIPLKIQQRSIHIWQRYTKVYTKKPTKSIQQGWNPTYKRTCLFSRKIEISAQMMMRIRVSAEKGSCQSVRVLKKKKKKKRTTTQRTRKGRERAVSRPVDLSAGAGQFCLNERARKDAVVSISYSRGRVPWLRDEDEALNTGITH